MKIFLLTGMCLLITVISFSQKLNKATENLPIPAKGYYSIYRNAEKLTPLRENRTATVDADANNISKGYYSISSNREQLGVKYKAYESGSLAVTKGYYSIGNNSSKLDKKKL